MLYPLSYEDGLTGILADWRWRDDMAADIYLPFFVYGTLLPGQTNYFLWREAIVGWRPAVLRGARLYDLGLFPMLVDAPDGEARGLLVRVRPSSYPVALWLLDRLEGVELAGWGELGFRRARRIVRLWGEPPTVAWVYVGRATAVAGLSPIGPDWKTYRRRGIKSMYNGCLVGCSK